MTFEKDDLVIRTKRLQIKFTVNRNTIILAGDSAKGTYFEYVKAYTFFLSLLF